MQSKATLEEIVATLPASYREAMRETAATKPTGEVVKGYDFNQGVDYDKLFASYSSCGIQATNMARAIEEINKMIKWRLSDEPVAANEAEELKSEEKRKQVRCTIFLGYTSNMISCGIREIIRYLCQHKMVDCIVTTTGGIEEDIMKCMADTYIGDFKLSGAELRKQRLNRTGNMIVPNDNYNIFEDWAFNLFSEMYQEQKTKGTIFTPSMIIDRLGKEINNPESVYYWCHVNKIPVFCPALTDGDIGDVLYLFLEKYSDFIVNIAADRHKIDNIARFARRSGVIILGGGVIKHHICNANLIRDGTDYAVYINTGVEYDASDAGATPDEAVSWGKISLEAKPVKIYCEASLVFPLIVAQTFVKNQKLASKLN
eukprot:TRINITY_DN3831_c0_g1_i7.p1 TRINITY_DN3831_c0_g1~~TRINITY_DN3831_c0_g1_i7.p1  ORF type:complete len:372 (+),score=105.61 TRINITY_DN3831_c0_g1_i7:264-1379(+)